MSEANILNPSASSLLNFDYGYTDGLPEMRSLFQAASGKMFSRRQFGRGRVYELAWNNRDKATMHTLRQWAQQYENDFFALVDWERTRYFSGRFEGPLQFSPAGNDKWNVKGRFIELPGAALRRINLLDNSEELDLSPWVKGFFGTGTAPTIGANAVADPNGRITAERINFAAAGVGPGDSRVYQANLQNNYVGAFAGKTFTFSIWLRADSATAVRVALYDSDGTNLTGTDVAFNLTTSWQRYSVTLTLQSDAISFQAIVSNGENFAKTAYAWGAMVNEGSSALPLFPDWYRDAIFLEERDGFGQDLVKLTGSQWGGFTVDSLFHGGGRFSNNNINTGDAAEWLYFGYSFRFWNGKQSNRGIGELSVTRVRDGVQVVAATNIDQYDAAVLQSAPLFAKDLPLDFYRVKYKATNTKNAANTSGSQFIDADAIEVMQ